MKRNWSGILILLFLVAAFFMPMCSCSPQKRFDRLVRKHPELLKPDTIYSTKTFTVPAQAKDTGFKMGPDTAGFSALVSSLNLKIDSLQRRKLVQYIQTRPCLSDTLRVPLDGGGIVKLWQQGGELKFSQRQPQKVYSITYPSVTYRPEIVRRYSWGLLAIGVILGWASLFLLIIYLKGRA